MRSGCTSVIANNRGHLNSNKLHSQKSPWGDFLGTWQRPKKPIHLQVKTKFMAQQERTQAKSAVAHSQVHSDMPGQEEESRPLLAGVSNREEQGESSSVMQSQQNPGLHQDSSAMSPLPRTPVSASQASHEEQSRPSAPSPYAESSCPSSVHSTRPDSCQTGTLATPSRTPSQISTRQGSSRQSLDSQRIKSAPNSRNSSRSLPTQPTSSARVRSAATYSSRPSSRTGSAQRSRIGSAVSDGASSPSSSDSSRPPTQASDTRSTKEAGVQCPSIATC